MKESMRKPILFAVIVVVGSVLVLFDIPLVILVPFILVVGFFTLLALGSITIAEIREGIAGLGKTGILKRLNDIKFFEKKAADTIKITSPLPEKNEGKKGGRNEERAKPGFTTHITAFFSSIGSLRSVLRQRSSQTKKVEDINRLLDKTVSEKVPAPAPAGTAPAIPAGGGGASSKTAPDLDDPFLSLSGDEFDEGLLDGLGDDGGLMTPAPAPAGEPAFDPKDFPDLEPESPDLPPPTPAVSPPARDIPVDTGAGAGGGLDEFAGLDGGDLSDTDFGDLDNLSLDDISLDADRGDTPAPGVPDAPAPAAAPAADSNAVKTAWVPSDAPKDANELEDEVSTQADMAAFAGGSAGDEDLLSSIASDVKHAAKEQDLSLLRDLKDFRAPASEIENELGGMYERMNRAQQTKRKNPPDAKGK
jgi:hypothetical protein